MHVGSEARRVQHVGARRVDHHVDTVGDPRRTTASVPRGARRRSGRPSARTSRLSARLDSRSQPLRGLRRRLRSLGYL